MKLGLLGDTHFTNRGPDRRIDNYWDTLYDKANQALTIFENNGCDEVIQTGDFFDAPTIACRVKAALIHLLRKYKREVCCVFGQHDITGHSSYTLANSPLAVLQAAEVVRLLDKNFFGLSENICLFGAGFGEEVPKIYDAHAYNILVIHKMIGDRPLYPGQDLMNPRKFLRQHQGYNLVVCGDYHYRFIETWEGRTIINPGAMVRKTIVKFDLEHKPAVVIFDTETNTSEIIELNVRSPEEVFDLTKVKIKKYATLLQFVERLKNRNEKTIGWKKILLKVLKERNSSEEVGNVIDLCLEEVEK